LHNTRMKSAPLDIFSSEECDRSHATTVDILRQIGIHVPHAEARWIPADAGARLGPDE
jgi:trimethylamine:corrinoid methyltransferase-like protein